MRAFFFTSLLLAVVAHCADPPISQAPRTDYPCGIDGVVCVGADNKPTGWCCDEGNVCGGAFPNVGCPEHACCFEGVSPDPERERGDAGGDGRSVVITGQWRAR